MSALIWPTQAILQARSDWVTLPFFNNAKLFSLYLDGPTQCFSSVFVLVVFGLSLQVVMDFTISDKHICWQT